MKDGEPCEHRGCLHHISHPCEKCGRIAGKNPIYLDDAFESYKFGFATIYDGDHHTILYGTHCNHCGEYFESKEISVYCDKCRTYKTHLRR